MRIVVLDAEPVDDGDVSWEGLALLGTLELHRVSSPSEVRARCLGARVVVTNKVPVSAHTLGAAAASVRLVCALATGRDHIDLSGMPDALVTNVPAYATAATAQHTVALLLELAHHVGAHASAVRAGLWGQARSFCFWDTPQRDLSGVRIGVVGRGDIGRRVAAIASALGMDVRFVATPGREGEGRIPWAAALPWSDVLTLHIPLTDATLGLLDDAALAQMRRGAWVLNTARGRLVDADAMAGALRSGHIGGYAADVLPEEPPRHGSPLIDAPHCVITPHLAWTAVTTRQRLIDETTRNVSAWLAGAPIRVLSASPL